MPQIVINTDGKVRFGGGLAEVVIDSLDHRGSEFLRGEAVPSADHFGRSLALVQRVDNVEIERFAGGSGFFCAIEDPDLLYRGRKRFNEMFDRERAIEADFNEADLFSASGEV